MTLLHVWWVQVSFLHFFLFTWSMSTLAMTLASFITRATIVNLTVFISFVLIMFMTLFLAMGRAYESFFAYDAALWVKFLVYPMPWTHFGKVCTPVVSARDSSGSARGLVGRPPHGAQIFVDIIDVTGYEGALFVSGFYSVSDLSQPGYEVDPHSDPPPGSARTISTGDSLGYLMLLVVVYYILAWWVNVCARACGCVVQALTRGSYMPWGRYLGQVFAGDLGASQPFYFPFTQAYWTGKRPAEKIVAGDTLAEVRATSAQRRSIELHKLSKAYASKTAVQEVSLSIYPGQLLALLGQNGAGTVPSGVCPLHTSCANAVLYGCQARLHWCTCWLACSIPRTVLPLCVVEALAKTFRCCETKLAPGESSMASCG